MTIDRLAYLTVLALGACTGVDASTALNEPVVDTLDGGIVRVTNPGPTRWVDTNGWKLVEETIIRPEEGSPGELSEARRLVADDSGYVYVMQREPVTVKVFGPDGAWVRDIGREGDGPGEFRDGMLGIHGDTLIIQDANNSRITIFLTDGSFLGTTKSQCCYFMSNFTVLTDGLAMVPGPPPPGFGEAAGAFYLTRMDGTVTDTIALPKQDDRDTEGAWTVTRRSGRGTSMMSAPIPGTPQEEGLFRADGRHVSGTTDLYRLAITRGFTDTLRVIEATAPQLKRTEAERDSVFEDAIANISEGWRDAVREVADRGQIPADRPLWSGMMTDQQNRIWVGLPGPGTDVATLEVFSPDGVLLGKVPAPHPKILDGFWTRDHLYLRDETELGLPMIRVYRLQTD